MADNRHGHARAVIHKRILEEAESRPDATVAELAGEVSGATPALVEQVLAEYGDPAEDEPPAESGASEEPTTVADPATADSDPAMTDTDSTTTEAKRNGEATPESTAPALSAKQRRALRLVRRNPDASQADIANELDVTRATVSRWLNDVPGFEWSERRAFVESLGEDALATDSEDRLADLEARLAALEDSRGADAADGESVLPADLAHRVVHACMASDRLSEDEELAVLRALMGS